MRKIFTIAIFTLLVWTHHYCVAEDLSAIDTQINALSNNLGGFPAQFKNDQEKASVTSKYKSIKASLDKLLEKNPNDEQLLFYRGKLQNMGHNADYKGAWQGANDDLVKLLKINPSNVPALTLLANHWVNSEIGFASRAEKLYIAAQCYHGDEPLEEVQRGLFFAFYYQGKIQEAAKQARFLTDKWSEIPEYKTLSSMALEVLAKKHLAEAKKISGSSPKTMISCTKKP
jgi:tetratricopeptide (TPR) repeat protein